MALYSDENKRKNRRDGMWMLAIFGVIALLCGAYLGYFAPTHTVHEYEIKAEQVYDNDRINESVELQQLSEDERSLLHGAFKKSDHFLGSSEVVIERQEKLDTFDGWKVVEYQGVYILVAIDGPDSRTTFSGWFPWAVLCGLVISGAGALMGLKSTLFPSRRRY